MQWQMLIKTLEGLFCKNWQAISKIHTGIQKAKMTKTISKNKVEGLILPAIKTYSKAIIILRVLVQE